MTAFFVDESSHFSVWDAARAGGVPVHAFRHRNAAHLAAVLRRRLRPGERPLLFSDGVFPISGEIAPLPHYLDVLCNYDGADICLDDAHATGVLGPHGRGTLEFWATVEIMDPLAPGDLGVLVVSSHTLSKALGGHGGVIPGDAALIERLGRISILGASSPPTLPAAAASAWALNHLRDHPERHARLRSNVAYARMALRRLGWALEDSPVPILCLHAGNWQGEGAPPDLARLRQMLYDRHICVAHVTRYSSTPEGGALRIAIFATHTTEQIDRLAAELGNLVSRS